MTDVPPKPRVLDNPDIGEIYANRVIGASFDGGAISILVGCARVIPERVDTTPTQGEPPSVYVTGRLALSPAAAVELVNILSGILTTLAKSPSNPISFPGGVTPKPN
jgi:hypothetical protein